VALLSELSLHVYANDSFMRPTTNSSQLIAIFVQNRKLLNGPMLLHGNLIRKKQLLAVNTCILNDWL